MSDTSNVSFAIAQASLCLELAHGCNDLDICHKLLRLAASFIDYAGRYDAKLEPFVRYFGKSAIDFGLA